MLTVRLLCTVLFLACGYVGAQEQETSTFDGSWRTTNRKLDGTMTCVVTQIGDEKWQGRFYGVWQGVAFDYVVTFTGPPSNVQGTATIDGASYKWTGQISEQPPRSFKGTFGGSRYTGHFDLREKTKTSRQRTQPSR